MNSKKIKKIFKNKKNAFTIVELVVVITILAILATIWFVSYKSYLVWTRDTTRILNMKAIADGLDLYRTEAFLPLPDDRVEIKTNWTLIARQGYVGESIIDTIKFSTLWKDPEDDIYYSYYLTKDRDYFQLMWFLEKEENLQVLKPNLLNKTEAIDYGIRYPTVYWHKLGILTTVDNTPIQEDSVVSSSWYLNITPISNEVYIAHFEDGNMLTGSWSDLFLITINANCDRIFEILWFRENWFYDINPDGTWELKVYCHMTDIDNNMLEVNWAVWDGTIWEFIKRGDYAENQRVNWTIPFRETDVLRQASPSGNQWWDWGWVYHDIPTNEEKTYRVSMWAKRTWDQDDGYAYLWCEDVEEFKTSSWIWVTETNPYFRYGDLPELDKWFLIVWYIHWSGHTDTNVYWWIYDLETKSKIKSTHRDYRHLNWSTIQDHRGFIRGDGNAIGNNKAYFYAPRFEEISKAKVWYVDDLFGIY